MKIKSTTQYKIVIIKRKPIEDLVGDLDAPGAKGLDAKYTDDFSKQDAIRYAASFNQVGSDTVAWVQKRGKKHIFHMVNRKFVQKFSKQKSEIANSIETVDPLSSDQAIGFIFDAVKSNSKIIAWIEPFKRSRK